MTPPPIWLHYIPLRSFLLALAEGWRFSRDIAEPIDGPHEEHSTLMWRPDTSPAAPKET